MLHAHSLTGLALSAVRTSAVSTEGVAARGSTRPLLPPALFPADTAAGSIDWLTLPACSGSGESSSEHLQGRRRWAEGVVHEGAVQGISVAR